MNNKNGMVILAGAGPGDPELITVKAARFLALADVVICDRLASPDILDRYIPNETLILTVGKQGRDGASTPQSLINELLLGYAQQGKLVVRLKGGDVSFFSNIMDELQILSLHNIKYEIIPGITAASGAAAYAGIPLTARGYSNAVRILTFYKNGLISESYWKELADTDDTLVFYMSSGSHESLVSNLLARGIDEQKYIAVIEQGTTAYQQVHCSQISVYLAKFQNRKYASPSLIIIGKVAALHEEFAWKENSDVNQSYFKPVLKNLTKEERA